MDASLWGTCHFWGRGDGPVAACRGPAHACRPRLCAQVALSKNQRAGLALRTKGVTLLSQRAHSGWAQPRAPPRGQRWTGRPWNWSFPEWAWWGRASQFCRDLGSHRLCSFCGHRRARAGWVCCPHGSAEEAAGNSRLRGACGPWPGGRELGGWSAVGPGGTGAFAIRQVDETQVLSLGRSWDPSRHVGSAGPE